MKDFKSKKIKKCVTSCTQIGQISRIDTILNNQRNQIQSHTTVCTVPQQSAYHSVGMTEGLNRTYFVSLVVNLT